MKSFAVVVAVVAVFAPQAASACRVHINAEQRAKDEAASRERDAQRADVIVKGSMVRPDPDCSGSSCPIRILATDVLKGDRQNGYDLDTQSILVGCSPQLSLGESGTFFLTKGDAGYLQIRGEKDDR